MDTGKQPFIGNTYAAVIQKIIEGHVPCPSRVNDRVEPDTDRIVMKALNREPSKRFSTALEMARTIEVTVGQDKIWGTRNKLRRLAAGSDTVDVPSQGLTNRRRGGRLAGWLTAMAAGVVIIAAGYGALQRPDILRDLRIRASALLQRSGSGEREELLEASGTPDGSMEVMLSPPVSSPDSGRAETDNLQAQIDTIETLLAAGPPAGIAPEPDILKAAAEPIAENAVEEQENIEVPPDDPVPATGLIEIYVQPESEIHIDGRWRASADRFGPAELTTGPHDLTLKQRGFRDYTERIVIRRGELSRRRIELQRITGGLDFKTIAGASVIINGKFHGTTPLQAPILLPAGKYLVELKKHGYLTWTGEVDIPTDETLDLKINMIQRQQ
jgi:hypothetical protein